MSVYRFIRAEEAAFPIAFMCRRLGVSRSGYYAWRGRSPAARALADAGLAATIRAVRERSRGTSGAPGTPRGWVTSPGVCK